MIKLIVFDLDGVLVEAKKIHYEALNEALEEKYKISWEDHLNKYDGLKTYEKLNMLTKQKGLKKEDHDKVWDKKQNITSKKLKNLKPDESLINCFDLLKKEGYKLACCSNSIRKTILIVLSKLGIIEYFDFIVSNEDVNNSKPHPEMYWKAMSYFSVTPEETMIFEDSPYGLISATRSGANVVRVVSPKEINFENIKNKLVTNNKKLFMKWKNSKLNVLVPMAGAGSRFEKAGYTFPKPLIEVNGKPMIQLVVENLGIDANYIFVVQKSHRQKYNLDTLLKLIAPNCKIVEVSELTGGAAISALAAKEFIDNDNPLFFANSDQFVNWNPVEFMYKMQETNVDGGIVTFKSTHPKWSFVKLDSDGFVSEVSEKNPISETATVGFYYWKNGSDFVKYAESMVRKNIRVNNEFYVCPVFNEAILDSKKITTFEAKEMWGLGTPEDLNNYLENFKD